MSLILRVPPSEQPILSKTKISQISIIQPQIEVLFILANQKVSLLLKVKIIIAHQINKRLEHFLQRNMTLKNKRPKSTGKSGPLENLSSLCTLPLIATIFLKRSEPRNIINFFFFIYQFISFNK